MKSEKSPLNTWKMKRNWKRKGLIVLPMLEDKNPWEKMRENDKETCFESGPVEESEKSFWKFWSSERHMREKAFKKNLQTDFWLIEKQVRSIENYIRLIQHQSS